jgi:DNA-binding winged helix-turn-helix (wHTH) protein/tetratricopeptide (TPR) repeat protein
MDAHVSSGAFLFDQFRLDRRAGGLFRYASEGKLDRIPLGSRALDVLCKLVEASGELVQKDDIIASVWHDQIVGDANLTVQISALRRVLDQGRRDGSCIQTVAGHGYRFVPVVTRMDKALPPHAPDRRMSVVILPFVNSSGHAAQDSLAAEITRHLTERITRGGDGPVIAGVTPTVSHGGLIDPYAIGREHSVHFALAGDARRQDGRLIVSAALYDTAEGRAVWGQQVNVPDDPNALSTIGQVIYENWWQASVDAEALHAARDRPDRLDKRDLLLMALATPLSTATKANYVQRLSLVDRALAQDPNYFPGLERRARLHAEFVLRGYSSDPAGDLAIATEAADHALAINPNSLNSLRVKATVLRARGDWTTAEALLRRVLTLQPTEANRHSELGECLMAQGRHPEALVSFQTARRFAGGSDAVYRYDGDIAMANLALGQLAEAMAAARLAIGEMPPDIGRSGEVPWLALIAAISLGGNEEVASADLQKFLTTPRSWYSMAEVLKWSAFAANHKLLHGLSRAGMPPE